MPLSSVPVPPNIRIDSSDPEPVSDWRYVSTAYRVNKLTSYLLTADRLDSVDDVSSLAFNAPRDIVSFSALVEGKDQLFGDGSDNKVDIRFGLVDRSLSYVSFNNDGSKISAE